ncbi:aldo/keto reductase [Halopelagius longus]|uniref:Aldo/keto reductase n=1 Tax=Halopelagius longus TaxID=1236180 RepID=A0A1H0YJL0_9EURY|nr:aldo/keto reductase [Halopelagius longus]RDI72526.1 aldo/keto reductase [Halopelagius longus]SDQ15387.1 Aldo/keto reductase [Halopelagius longus]
MEIPDLGLGTYKMEETDECATAVETATAVGYRHIDTAQMYHNEAAVGDGIMRADVDREDLFVASKIEPESLAYDDVVESTRQSAQKLGADSIDLMYVHWPTGAYDPEETLPALDELVEEGVIERVGLSNFRPDQLEDAIDRLDAPVYAHQVEMHPMLPQEELHELAVEHDHQLVAYCPIARNQVADVPEIREVAEKHDATAAQVSLAWLTQKENVTAIPKAASEDHIRQNYAALDIELDDEDVAAIDGIDERHRIVDPDDAPWNQN